MTALHVTSHAVERYIERVAAVSRHEADQALRSKAIQAAAEFGASCVRLATGQRIVLDGCSVITVLPAGNFKRQVGRCGLRRYGKACHDPEQARNDAADMAELLVRIDAKHGGGE